MSNSQDANTSNLAAVVKDTSGSDNVAKDASGSDSAAKDTSGSDNAAKDTPNVPILFNDGELTSLDLTGKFIDFQDEIVFVQDYGDGEDEYVLEFEICVDFSDASELEALWPQEQAKKIVGSHTFKANHIAKLDEQNVANIDWRVYQKIQETPTHAVDVDIYTGKHLIKVIQEFLKTRRILYTFNLNLGGQKIPIRAPIAELLVGNQLETHPSFGKLKLSYKVKLKPRTPTTAVENKRKHRDTEKTSTSGILIAGSRTISDLVPAPPTGTGTKK